MSKLPASNPAQSGTENRFGVMRFGKSNEVTDTNRDDLALSPARLNGAIDTYVPDSTTAVKGKIEISTDAEAQAKTATDKALVPSNLAASGFLQYADVTITAAEVKAARATPVTLVAAPAAGSAHMFMGAMLKLNYGSEVFTETADNFAIKYTDGSGVAVSAAIENTGFIDQSADTITNAIPVADAIVVATGAEAQALVLHNTGDGEIAGNASDDSTVTVRTYYVTQAL